MGKAAAPACKTAQQLFPSVIRIEDAARSRHAAGGEVEHKGEEDGSENQEPHRYFDHMAVAEVGIDGFLHRHRVVKGGDFLFGGFGERSDDKQGDIRRSSGPDDGVDAIGQIGYGAPGHAHRHGNDVEDKVTGNAHYHGDHCGRLGHPFVE